MPYGKSEDIKKLKKKIEEKMPGINIDNLSQSDMQKMIVNEINKDNSIDPAIKEKINRGDIEGLKEDIIRYLSKNKGGDGERLANMLKNNDMEGIKNQLMSMLLGGMNSQKKNEITSNSSSDSTDITQALTPQLAGNGLSLANLLSELPLNNILTKLFEMNKNDNRVIFLNSMKPFVSEKRQKSIDDCVKILGALAFFEKLNNKVGT